eukprot:7391729-Prymnesium_polylepis.3
MSQRSDSLQVKLHGERVRRTGDDASARDREAAVVNARRALAVDVADMHPCIVDACVHHERVGVVCIRRLGRDADEVVRSEGERGGVFPPSDESALRGPDRLSAPLVRRDARLLCVEREQRVVWVKDVLLKLERRAPVGFDLRRPRRPALLTSRPACSNTLRLPHRATLRLGHTLLLCFACCAPLRLPRSAALGLPRHTALCIASCSRLSVEANVRVEATAGRLWGGWFGDRRPLPSDDRARRKPTVALARFRSRLVLKFDLRYGVHRNAQPLRTDEAQTLRDDLVTNQWIDE